MQTPNSTTISTAHPHLFDRHALEALRRSRAKYGPIVTETVPTQHQILSFFNSLDDHHTKDAPLSSCFTHSSRDLCTAVTHRIPEIPEDLRSKLTAQLQSDERCSVVLNLFTVTQDCTFRCSTPYSEGWESGLFTFPSGRIACYTGNPSTSPFIGSFLDLLHLSDSLLSPLQRFLLTARPAFLHTLRVDHVNSTVVISMEIARRYRSGRESDICEIRSVDISHWESRTDFSRAPATPAQITLWAAFDLVVTAAAHDAGRLTVIQQAIDAEVAHIDADAIPSDVTLPVPVLSVNRVALLRVRSAVYQDGRGRYAVAQGALHSRSLLPSATENEGNSNSVMNGFNAPLDPMPIIHSTRIHYPAVARAVAAECAFAAPALLYLLRLRAAGADVEEVVLVTTFLFLSLFLFSKFSSLSILLSGSHPLIRPASPGELIHAAATAADGNVRGRLSIATSDMGRAFYDGRGLSFLDSTAFRGTHRFPAAFAVSALLRAGFMTTFARDGRETLIDPAGKAFRLSVVREGGRCSFSVTKQTQTNEKEQKGQQQHQSTGDLEAQVLAQRAAAGIWASDLVLGRDAEDE